MSGFAFSDDNGNCIWDEGEAKIEGVSFTITPGETRFASGVDGTYSQRLAAGNYSILMDSHEYWEMVCQVNVSVTGTNNNYNQNLPLRKKQNGYDLQVTSGVTAWRRGFANESVVQASNTGTSDAINAKIEVTYPDGVDLKSASIPWDEVIGNTYIWYIDTFKTGESLTIYLQDSVTTDVSINDELTLSSNIIADGTDVKMSNNTYAQTVVIVGAIDPNDILVTPKGKGSQGFIDGNQLLRYHIRFQNVGTYKASRVVLENKLSQFLDIATFRIESVSHPGFSYVINQDGLLTVKFNQIELPDSTTNEVASHGFFIYTIVPKKTAKGGSRIENNVFITFDYEDPLLSNTVVNTIRYTGKPEVSDMIIFPNPAVSDISVIADNITSDKAPVIRSLRILSTDGRVIREISNSEELLIQVQVSDLAPGLYSVLGSDEGGTIYQGKFIKL